MEKSNSHHENFKYSRRARIQQKQRDITDDDLNTVIQSGEQIECKDSKIYVDQNTKIILRTDTNVVIAVNKNNRNSNFPLTVHTKERESFLLQKVNMQNDSYSMCELAELYLSGEIGEKNVEEAFNLFKRAADKGNSHAMGKISQLYESGDLGEPNQKLADKWMKRAADRNNVFALAETGRKLLRQYLQKYPLGSNIFRPSAPKKEILHYLNKAADEGSIKGTKRLGDIYKYGLLGEKDLFKAIEYYVKAAKLKGTTSLEQLYCMKLELSAKEFEDILDRVSSFLPTSSVRMALQLGREQIFGYLGYNPVRGLNMIEQAAVKKYDQAILQLAECYRDGIGCDVNLKLAQYWFIRLGELYDASAKAGNVASLWDLGQFYLNGNFNNIDLERAEMCFEKAIEISSDPDWMFDLGKLYLQGELGDKPLDRGIELIAKAINIWQSQADSGDRRAYYDLGFTYSYINNHKKAVCCLSKSPTDDTDSQLCLAQIYLDNLSQEKNISLGLTILKSAILENGVSRSEAFDYVDFTINEQTIVWLHDIADNIVEPIANENSNQYLFKRFVITTLAKIYETGELGEVNYDLASKYYNQLFVDFKNVKAGNKLVWIYNNQHLPAKYHDTVKNWVLQIPVLLETRQISWIDFKDCILLLAKMYQIGNILPHDVLQATKWLYLALYYYSSDKEAEQKQIKCDLSKLPPLDYNQKLQMVSELSELAKHNKMTAPSNYKVLSRILGDIYGDDKIVKHNIDESIYWYTESANTNNGLASFKLAKIYQYNKKDISTSINWYMLSAQQGNKDAINALTQLTQQKDNNDLSSFLDKYQHRSSVPEADWVNVKPLKNLDFYPKTVEQMYELGKSYMNSKREHDILNAAFWFREAMEKDSIDAGLELYSMYKSGDLGINLIPYANLLYLDILKICYSKLNKNKASQSQNISSRLSLLKNLSSALKLSKMITANTLDHKVEKLIKSHDIDAEKLADIIAELETLIMELYSQTTISSAVDACLLAKKISEDLIV